MSSFFGMVNLLITCGTLLAISMMVLLSLPESRLRDVAIQIVGWLFAAFCAFVIASPLDIAPDFIPVIGMIDDVGAAVAGVSSAVAAWKAGARRAA